MQGSRCRTPADSGLKVRFWVDSLYNPQTSRAGLGSLVVCVCVYPSFHYWWWGFTWVSLGGWLLVIG